MGDLEWGRNARLYEVNIHRLRGELSSLAAKFDIFNEGGSGFTLQTFADELHLTNTKLREITDSSQILKRLVPHDGGEMAVEKARQLNRLDHQLSVCIKQFHRLSERVRVEMDTSKRLSMARQQSLHDESAETVAQQKQALMQGQNMDELAYQVEIERQMEQLADDMQATQDIFTHLNFLVNDQRDKVDDLVAKVEDVEVKVEESKKQLDSGIVNQRKARKKKIILFIVLLVIVILLISIVFGVFLG